jgi:glycolate oxidase FAD binding subunit
MVNQLHNPQSFHVADLTPARVEMPANEDELARIVAECVRANEAMIAWGGGTRQHLGGIPRRYDVAIQTTRLNQIVEYAPDDLTVTVQAGMTLGALQEQLATRHQFLPLDPPLANRATIGGILATNACGPLRLRFGAARDFTLGLRVVNASGTPVKFGGKVVKNVAGYELTKLHIGALGTLGIITQATFKVLPKPPEQSTFIAIFSDARAACDAITALWNLTTAPLALELFDANLARALGIETKGCAIAARFGGTRAIVDAANEKASKLARNIQILPDALLWNRIADLPETLRVAHTTLLRISAPPASLNAALEKIAERARALKIAPPQFFAHAATAMIYLAFSASDAQTIETIKHLRWTLAPLHATVIVESAPHAVKEQIPVWGEPGAAHFLTQRIKAQFDPKLLMNVGRFVGNL